MKKRKLKKKALIVGIVVIIVIALLFVIFKIKLNNNPILGSWISKGGTIYQFDKNNKGKMIVPLSEYSFKYKIEDNKISIDYESEAANDAEYEYSISDDVLTLKGKKGTFTFTKNK